ncbi:MAG TPA: ATP-binding cassette domain-containing protein [Novosphingobium sp.]|nr:ATP-binding cassette domain-containing protein [Novosphingobium sp.]
MPDAPPLPPRLIGPEHHRPIAALVALMTLAAATEGLGIILLVPLLGALGQGDSGSIGAMLRTIGLPLRLDLLLALFVGLVALRAVVVHLRTLAGMRFETAVVDALRHRAWAALLHCEWRALLGMSRSNTASLLINRVDRAGTYVNQGILAASTLVTLGGVALAALAIAPLLTAGAVLAGALVLLAFHGMRRRAAALGDALGKAYAGVHGRLDEGLGALRAIKGLGREDKALTDLVGEFAGLRETSLAYLRDVGRGQIVLQAGGAAVLAVLVWLALERWHSDAAVVLPMVALFARALPLIGTLQQAGLNAAHARPAVDEALALIARAEAAREADAGPGAPPALDRAIRLEGVTVRFEGEPRPALDTVTASIPARGITAITGPSGAGKSTLADLIGGLLSPDDGTVRIDDTVLAGPARRAWRSRVAYVQQDPVLLAASLRDNLRWAAPEADDAALAAALRAASAGFALDLPLGLDTRLGDGGRALSGGERQRLMLARALLRDPALLILDEATSALDPGNEAEIAAALEGLRHRMAVVVIAHRGTLADRADQVIRLENGRIAA